MKMTQEQKDARKAAREYEQLVKKKRDRLASSKEDAARKNMPDPTIAYYVGDRVKYGNWDWSGILKVYEGGRYYKLFSVTWKTGRNITNSSENKIHYLPWYDFQPYHDNEEDDTRERFEQDDDIFISYNQRDMSSLMNYYFSKYDIDLEPEYQRGNVWTLEQKRSLIDSIFHNVDIGKMAIIKRPWGPNNKPATPKLYEMLDGKQRLIALIEYYTGQFTYRGKYHHELCWRDKGHFKTYSISIAETEPLTKKQKYRYFLKLNSTGTPVDPEHMTKVAGLLQKEIENG